MEKELLDTSDWLNVCYRTARIEFFPIVAWQRVALRFKALRIYVFVFTSERVCSQNCESSKEATNCKLTMIIFLLILIMRKMDE